MSELGRLMADAADDLARQVLAECVIGPKGEHFDGVEWERRADEWHGRVKLAESLVAREMAGR